MFIKNTFESDAGEKVYIPQGSTQTAAKLMHQSNLKGDFFKLFFENRGRNWVILKHKAIIFSGLENINLEEFKEKILKLEPANRAYIF